jgi:hypothetical protein
MRGISACPHRQPQLNYIMFAFKRKGGNYCFWPHLGPARRPASGLLSEVLLKSLGASPCARHRRRRGATRV